jgi:hypothetical protein
MTTTAATLLGTWLALWPGNNGWPRLQTPEAEAHNAALEHALQQASAAAKAGRINLRLILPFVSLGHPAVCSRQFGGASAPTLLLASIDPQVTKIKSTSNEISAAFSASYGRFR